MAVYKVIQDIEAEDKLIGPLGLKGFIYAGIAALCAFISFRISLITSLGAMRWPIIFALVLPMILFIVLALPLGHDQPTEVWLLSHIKFLLAARQRVWDQSGIIKLVTITAPKKLEKQLTKNFSGDEVKSRLQALATTLDSRGWALKNVNVSISNQPDYMQAEHIDSDRLVGASTLVKETSAAEVHASDDIMDEKNNATAQNFNQQLQKADRQRRKNLLERVEKAVKAATIKPHEEKARKHSDHHPKPSQAGEETVASDSSQDAYKNENVVKPRVPPAKTLLDDDDETVTDEASLLAHIKEDEQNIKSHPHPVTKLSEAERKRRAENGTLTEVTGASQAAKLELAQSGNDLSVASIASLANRSLDQQPATDEVVISLH